MTLELFNPLADSYLTSAKQCLSNNDSLTALKYLDHIVSPKCELIPPSIIQSALRLRANIYFIEYQRYIADDPVPYRKDGGENSWTLAVADYQRLISYGEDEISLDDLSGALLNLGAIYIMLGKLFSAKQLCQRATALTSRLHFQSQPNLEGAKAVECVAGAWLNLGMECEVSSPFLHQLNAYNQIILLRDRGVNLGLIAEARFRLGYIWARNRSYARGLSYADHLGRMDRQGFALAGTLKYLLRSYIFNFADDNYQAIRAIKRAISMCPSWAPDRMASAVSLYAQLLIKMGRRTKAFETLGIWVDDLLLSLESCEPSTRTAKLNALRDSLELIGKSFFCEFRRRRDSILLDSASLNGQSIISALAILDVSRARNLVMQSQEIIIRSRTANNAIVQIKKTSDTIFRDTIVGQGDLANLCTLLRRNGQIVILMSTRDGVFFTLLSAESKKKIRCSISDQLINRKVHREFTYEVRKYREDINHIFVSVAINEIDRENVYRHIHLRTETFMKLFQGEMWNLSGLYEAVRDKDVVLVTNYATNDLPWTYLLVDHAKSISRSLSIKLLSNQITIGNNWRRLTAKPSVCCFTAPTGSNEKGMLSDAIGLWPDVQDYYDDTTSLSFSNTPPLANFENFYSTHGDCDVLLVAAHGRIDSRNKYALGLELEGGSSLTRHHLDRYSGFDFSGVQCLVELSCGQGLIALWGRGCYARGLYPSLCRRKVASVIHCMAPLRADRIRVIGREIGCRLARNLESQSFAPRARALRDTIAHLHSRIDIFSLLWWIHDGVP